jgi:ABC-type amino acid transport substrate-binding protein
MVAGNRGNFAGELAGVETSAGSLGVFGNRLRGGLDYMCDRLLEAIMVRISKMVALIAATILGAVGTASAQQQQIVALLDAEPGVIRNGTDVGGRDIDIWDAIAKDSGLRFTYVFMNVPQLLAALDEGKADVIGQGITPTPATETKYLLTDTLFQTAEALVVQTTDNGMYRSLDDIKNLSFATFTASPYADYLKKNRITIVKELDTIPAVVKAVTSGEANAGLFSGTIAGYLLKQGKLGDVRLVSSYQPALARPIVAAFPKSASENFNRANASLKKLNADGTTARIKAKYGL